MILCLIMMSWFYAWVVLCLVTSLPVDEGETLLETDRHFGGIDDGETVT